MTFKHALPLALVALLLSGSVRAEEMVVSPQVSPKSSIGPTKPAPEPVVTVDRICTLITTEADKNQIPREFFARLIWKESRFDHNAVSPVGAEGIAQFMPGTAKLVGLKDPFDIEQAIPASAAHLADLKRNLGNFGLAAAAYNAGEGRVGRWLSSGGFLPLETEDYVIDITGEPADNFTAREAVLAARPLDAKMTFEEACRKLPVIAFNTVAMASVNRKPWGVQVAGNFRRSAAVKQCERVRRQFASVFAGEKPVVSRVRTPIGRRGIYAVRIGANSRGEADRICSALRSAGGACIVMKNR
ncbi:MAG: transglycosylase SLT domain-containing protein [Rhizobiaceae bacterium]